MHRALQINEILHIILSELNEEKYAKYLLRLALVCKAFKNPALDMLWRNTEHGWGLEQFLYPFVSWGNLQFTRMKNFYEDDVDLHISLLRPITPQEMTAYQSYAVRVRHFVEFFRHTTISKDAMSSLGEALQGRPLFPCLWSTEVYVDTDFQPETFLFLCPSLRIIKVHGSYRELAPILVVAAELGVELTELWVNMLEEEMDSSSAHKYDGGKDPICPLLLKNPRIKRLQFDMPPHVVQDILRRCPPQTSVTRLDLGYYYWDEGTQYQLTEAVFPALKSLGLAGNTFLWEEHPPVCWDFFGGLSAVEFQSPPNDSLTGDFVFSFLSYISNRCKKPLEYISLYSRYEDEPSCDLSHLVSLTLGERFHLDISNEELLLLGESNPRLEHLCIGPDVDQELPGRETWHEEYEDYPDPRLELRYVVLFLRKVPNLRLLRLPARFAPFSLDVVQTVPLLEEWDVVYSTITLSDRTADALRIHVPHLKRVAIVDWVEDAWYPIVTGRMGYQRSLALTKAQLLMRDRILGFENLNKMLRQKYTDWADWCFPDLGEIIQTWF
ncbi:hypothetical protein FRC02_003532 [Tulasnella sp. 418]|nr:hypothetical protein FRC02_003532 [Tulasnella sp. 418]